MVKALPAELSGAALMEMPDESQAEETLEHPRDRGAGGRRRASSRSWPTTKRPTSLVVSIPRTRSGFSPRSRTAADIEELLRYDPETAGGLMTAQVVTVRATDTGRRSDRVASAAGRGDRGLLQVYVVDEA